MFTERYKSHHDASRDLKKRYTADIGGEDYLPAVLAGGAASRRVIYLHVPFCNKVCTFCPFHRPDELDRRQYHRYLLDEMRKVQDYPYMAAPIDAVNFGGGTPTSLSPTQMREVLAGLHSAFSIAPGAEISVETSATGLSDEMISVLREGGVNRLSVGIQTFDDGARRLLGRRGSGEFAASRVAAAIAAGIRNTSVDIIYNYPGQTDAQLMHDIDTVAAPDISGDIRICSRGRVLRPEYRVIDALIYAMQKGGTRLGPYSERLGIDLMSLFGKKLDEFSAAGYLTVSGDSVTLTRDGIFFGNNLLSELFKLG